MIVKAIKGRGFRGALEYDLQEQKGHVLDSNMAGDNPRSLAHEFGVVRVLRPNLTRAVLHASISIHPNETLSDEQWRQVARAYLEGMGFQNCQYIVTRHTDTEHPHIHILANRISMRGEVVSDSHDYKRQETIMRKLEREYGLRPVEMSKDAERKALSKGEVEHFLRTGEASVRIRLQELVDKGMGEQPTIREFVAKLAEHDVVIKLNDASTGRICGISFTLDGVAMKGSDLGKAYTWNSLQRRGLTYETGYHQGNELEGGHGTRTDPGQYSGRTPDHGNASGFTSEARDGEVAKQRRIDESFVRLEQAYQGVGFKRAEGRSRGKGLSR